MNRNPKEKTVQILLRLKPKDKERIQRILKQCGLSVSEYVLQRALGYTPKTVNPDAFFDFYGKLCELLNQELFPETEMAVLRLFDDIYAEFLDDRKQTAALPIGISSRRILRMSSSVPAHWRVSVIS